MKSAWFALAVKALAESAGVPKGESLMADPLFHGETAPLFRVAYDGVKLIAIAVVILGLGPLLLKPALSRFKPVVRLLFIGLTLIICIGYLLLHKKGLI